LEAKDVRRILQIALDEDAWREPNQAQNEYGKRKPSRKSLTMIQNVKLFLSEPLKRVFLAFTDED
jgi:hypothetical protein